MNTMKDKGAFTHIIDALEDRDEDIRTEAVRALSVLSKHGTLPLHD
jgi:HEAT repeat protein